MNDDQPIQDPIAGARGEMAPEGVQRATEPRPGESAGDVIDRYKLLEEIGEGGMGTVWMAQQTEPVKRRVALKIIKLGMDTREVIVRFEAERQALALMDHPHIAKVLDGGATDTGRPFFVMELVRGVPITEYCDRAKLGLRGRLELFGKVCEAIQHAHHKGVIHRDIKPTNVLVTLHDGVPVPKVIDFGIAKATSAELTQKTMFTQFAQIIGTPEYMAPEQAEMSGLDIDTRADVYSLGVLLYELLTGTKPFDIRTVLDAGYQELLRTIREVDPMRPSTRVSTMAPSTSPLADGRQVNVGELSKRLRGDLDWIVMKALEKDRARRYDTPIAFAADVARYLVGEPVEAAPPSQAYRLRKFVARRRKVVAVASAMVVLLVAGSVGTGVGWWKAKRANAALDLALAEKSTALEREERQREFAQASERAARSELARADQAAFLLGDLLRGVTPQSAQGADITPFRKALDRAEVRLTDGSIGDALVEARLRQTVGSVYFLLGLYDEADEHLPAALAAATELLPADDDRRLSIALDVGRLRLMQDRDEEAEPLLRTAFDGLLAARGPDEPMCMQAGQVLASLYASLGRHEDAQAVLLVGPDGGELDYRFDSAGQRNHARTLAMSLAATGRLDEAEALFAGVKSGCEQDPTCTDAERDALATMAALLAHERGDRESSLDMKRAKLAEFRANYGDDHPQTIVSLTDLATKEGAVGNFEVADALLTEALERATRTLGDEHSATLRARYAIAWLRQQQQRLPEAEQLFRGVLEDSNRVLGENNQIAISTRRDLGLLYSAMQRFDEAEPLMREALEHALATLTPDHREVLGMRTNLASVYLSLGRFAEAAEQAEISLEAKRRTLGPDHPWTNNATYVLANAYTELGRDEEALPLHREWLAYHVRRAQSESPPPGLRGQVASWLSTYPIEELRDPELASTLARAECERAEAEGDPRLWVHLDSLASSLFAAGEPAEAARVMERAIAVMPEDLPAGWREELQGYLRAYREAAGE